MSTTYTEAYTEQDKKLVEKINTWLQESDKSGADLSRLTGIKEGTRSSILNGKYVSSPTEFLLRMQDAVDNTNARNEAAKTEIPFTATSVAATVDQVCKRAHIDRDFGIFVGKVGVGKTTALRQYANRSKSAILVEAFDGMDHSTFVQELMIGAGLVATKGNTSSQIAVLIRALKGTDRIILVDESGSLRRPSFAALRRISDMAGIGVVLVGTSELLPMVQDSEGRFGQISSRIGFWPPLVTSISEKDCGLMVASYFSEAQPEPVVKAFYSCCEGSARTLRNLLRNSCRYALRNQAEITPDLIRDINTQAMAGRGYLTRGA